MRWWSLSVVAHWAVLSVLFTGSAELAAQRSNQSQRQRPPESFQIAIGLIQRGLHGEAGGYLKRFVRDQADHPLVRVHPVTGRKALYLGRRRIYPSQYVIGWGRAESEELLDFLWQHATQDAFKWTHTWRLGDMVLWDNRCAMHHRSPHTGVHRRIMHRTQLGRQAIIAA